MAKIIKGRSGTSFSYKLAIPKEDAEVFIEKYGNKVSIKKCGKGFKILPVSEVQDEQ